MKINDLRRIIQEELASILAENAPVKEPETPGTKEKEKNPAKPDKTRKWNPKPGVKPTIKNENLSEAEKELASKIAQRFLKLKK
jgi:hypothetical protein